MLSSISTMATVGGNIQVEEKFNSLQINIDADPPETLERNGEKISNFDLSIEEVYKLALSFYKEKEGKAIHLSYEDKLSLVAFSQQVLHGPLSEAISKLPPLGALDVVGRDRRVAWQKLGKLDVNQARSGFIELLSRRCPLFTAFLEAHRMEKKEQERIAKEETKRRVLEHEQQLKREAEEKVLQEQIRREEAIKRQIQQALNEQTYEQFRNYAEQQYPGDPEKQGLLVKQLQEQHYIQYMQQLQAAQRGELITNENRNGKKQLEATEELDDFVNANSVDSLEETLVPASMWTRADIQAFKQTISQAEGDSVVRVGHGETVTVRVPTHKDGARIFWEFATDHYDIGFGVYFEYGTPTTDQVSVHVSESDDEDIQDLDDLEDDEIINPSDFEAGSIANETSPKPVIMEIVPVYRRDCQTEVYAGSHQYPGQGVYFLKFDNSYSLWRSKTLYYRVYYSQ
ncbi:Golgi resident protein GCP60 isoform X2 [Photinus pyralis]|uniref:Golgi resident protein GCP60 isoform X2 n=1 Tax=Photinus pyralis TaxID=7054 RepID=UPI0012670134|nr:Golgi resident protein GCP60 isoform X2 [Photinus pyralis]